MSFNQELAMFKSRAPSPVAAASCADKKVATTCACGPDGVLLTAPKFSTELMRMLSQLVILR
jgi:hypothetical protein